MGAGHQPAGRGAGGPRGRRHAVRHPRLADHRRRWTASARRAYAEDASLDGRVWEALHVAHACAGRREFDLVHNHLDWLPLAFSEHCRAPLVTTIHGFSDRTILPAYQAATSAYVSISDADRVPELDYVATVYHGIDLSRFAFSADRRARTWSSSAGSIPTRAPPRPSRSPGLAGRRLLIAGPVQDQALFRGTRSRRYIDDDRVRYLGSVGPEQRSELLGSRSRPAAPDRVRRAVRALRRRGDGGGTPVVAYARGSMPEVVDEGVTGFLVDDVAGGSGGGRRGRSGSTGRRCRRVAERPVQRRPHGRRLRCRV